MQSILEKTIDYYDASAERYAKKERSLSHGTGIYLGEFVGVLKKGWVLDAGCRVGEEVNTFYKLGFGVVGVDLSEKSLAIAKEKVPEAHFCLMNMCRLGFRNEVFDGVWANRSLIHLQEKECECALEEFYRVLRDGGLFYCSVQEGKGEEVSDENRYYKYYGVSEFEKLLSDAGFKQSTGRVSEPSRWGKRWINVLAIKE
jgi:SAM-dependent methyltransferase